jgi:myo-inositol-1(or 4)-monophosphatase
MKITGIEDSNLQEELEVAVEAAEAAGKIIDKTAGGKAQIEGSKENINDIFTEADLQCQRKILEIIESNFPKDGFLGEEENLKPDGEDRVWIIDPIDGTSNFQRDIEYFCVSIALEIEGEIKLGVIYSPENGLGKLYYAAEGSGAYLTEKADSFGNAEKLEVSQKKLDEGSLIYSRMTNLEGEFEEQKELIGEIVSNKTAFRYMGAGALELCKVAEGSGEGFISHTEAKWDYAAAKIIIEEAGGEVKTEESQVDNKYKVMASNGKIQNHIQKLSEEFYR